jgi:hypothetical protein
VHLPGLGAGCGAMYERNGWGNGVIPASMDAITPKKKIQNDIAIVVTCSSVRLSFTVAGKPDDFPSKASVLFLSTNSKQRGI